MESLAFKTVDSVLCDIANRAATSLFFSPFETASRIATFCSSEIAFRLQPLMAALHAGNKSEERTHQAIRRHENGGDHFGSQQRSMGGGGMQRRPVASNVGHRTAEREREKTGREDFTASPLLAARPGRPGHVGYPSRSHWQRFPLGRRHGEIVLVGKFSSL